MQLRIMYLILNLLYNADAKSKLIALTQKQIIENRDFAVSRKMAEKYKDCITEDIYELLTEDY